MSPTEREANFIRRLEGLARNDRRGAMASLRRSAGKPPGSVPEALRWLAPWTANLSRDDALRYLLVAGLFALHPLEAPTGNLGHTAAQVSQQRPSGSLEARFAAVLRSPREELPGRLRQLIILAQAAGVAVNWGQLLADLRRWDDPRRTVQFAWAQAFWANGGSEDAASVPVSAPVPGC